MANEDLVLLEKDERNPAIAVLTLNRADAGNAFNTPMLEALAGRID